MRQLIKYFSPFMMEYKREFFFAVLGMIAVAVGTTVSAYWMKTVLDEGCIRKDKKMLQFILFAIIGIFMIKSVGRITLRVR